MKKEQIDELKVKVLALQKAVDELKKIGIRESVLLHAIQRNAKRHHTGNPIPITHIKFILKGVETIKEYLFPED
jgi:hypothetical protein